MPPPVRKAVFTVGGLGTRFLPATKAMPKEMLPIVDKPLIQYAVEEAAASGIEQFIFVTGRGKTPIEDHFDHSYELHRTLVEREKHHLVELLHSTTLEPDRVAYVRQQDPLGLGHAVWCARRLVGDEPFALLLPDDLILGDRPCLAEMQEAYQQVGGNLVAVQDVPVEHTSRYGILDVEHDDGRLASARGLVEKPGPEAAPSTLAIIGRYILQPDVFAQLELGERGAGGEIQITDAIAKTIGAVPFHGLRFGGVRYDCGDKAGYLDATLAFALQHPGLADDARRIIRDAAARLDEGGM